MARQPLTTSAKRFAAVVAACRDVARAFVALEAAFADLDVVQVEAKPRQKPIPIEVPAKHESPTSDFNSTERKILTVLAQHHRAMTMAQIGVLSKLRHSTGSFTQAVSRLRAKGYAEGPGSAFRITILGRDALGPVPNLPEGAELFEYWCGKVGGTAAKILRALRQAGGEDLSAEEIGEATMLKPNTGSFTQALATLRRLELIEGGGDSMVLSEALLHAVAPTISVFDRTTGKSVRVRAK